MGTMMQNRRLTDHSPRNFFGIAGEWRTLARGN
jgi:hypothetical protein